jgi:hypothetical protein
MRNMNRQMILLLFACLLSAPVVISGQAAPATANPPLLDTPPGKNVAIVAFECWACRDCALADPKLQQASAKYQVPLIRHDFPLRFHPWSYDAAILVRWFDGQARAGDSLGSRFRDALLASQSKIVNTEDLHDFAARFAHSSNISLPDDPDPQGILKAAVVADIALGKKLGFQWIPAIYVVRRNASGISYVEVSNVTHVEAAIEEAMSPDFTGFLPAPSK